MTTIDIELPGNFLVVPYCELRELELVSMWRASFERGVGVTDPHPLEDQVAYLRREVLPKNEVLLVLDGVDGVLAAFIAFSGGQVAHLYVHVDFQGRGIGRALLDVAKRESAGRLRLFTFAANARARRFYERNGFVEIAQGFEPHWRLADVEYAWAR